MADSSIARLNAIPWVASLIHDPKWTRVQTISRVLQSSGENSFYSETLATDRTMRSCLTLLPAAAADAKIAYREVLWIVEIGDGLNGYPGTLHGGMAATLLDEVCGILLQSNAAKASERAGTTDRLDEYMTACKSAGCTCTPSCRIDTP
jgi:thioesterase superfamily protein 4